MQKRLLDKVAEKVADSFVPWLLGVVASSGVVVGARAYLQERAPAMAALAGRFGAWALAAAFAILFLLAGLRARALKRERDGLLATQAQRVEQAAALARKQLTSELRSQWTEDKSLASFGLEAIDAWCFVHESESTWAVHTVVRAWSAIPLGAAITVVEATFAVDDGRKEIASLNPHVSWNPLHQGLNDPVKLSASLSGDAAGRLRAASKEGCVMLTVFVRVSLSLDGGAPTNPDRCRRRLEHPLRVQS